MPSNSDTAIWSDSANRSDDGRSGAAAALDPSVIASPALPSFRLRRSMPRNGLACDPRTGANLAAGATMEKHR